jgi:hypothetical protein
VQTALLSELLPTTLSEGSRLYHFEGFSTGGISKYWMTVVVDVEVVSLLVGLQEKSFG